MAPKQKPGKLWSLIPWQGESAWWKVVMNNVMFQM